MLASPPAHALEQMRITEILTSYADDSGAQLVEIASETFSFIPVSTVAAAFDASGAHIGDRCIGRSSGVRARSTAAATRLAVRQDREALIGKATLRAARVSLAVLQPCRKFPLKTYLVAAETTLKTAWPIPATRDPRQRQTRRKAGTQNQCPTRYHAPAWPAGRTVGEGVGNAPQCTDTK